MGHDLRTDAELSVPWYRWPRGYKMDKDDWKTHAGPTYHSPPRLRRNRVHNGSRQAPHGSPTTEAQVSTMPPPPHLARSPTDVYRRPGHWMAFDDSFSRRGRPRRDSSPIYRGRRHLAHEHSGYSSTSLVGLHGEAFPDNNGDDVDDDDGDDDNQIEVVEEMDSDSTRVMTRGRPGRNVDDYRHPNMAGGRHLRHAARHFRHESDEDENDDNEDRDNHHFHRRATRRRVSPSPGGEKPSRAIDTSPPWRRLPYAGMIDDTRPPVSSNRPTARRRHRSVEVVHVEGRPRRASRARSSHSRTGSMAGGPSAFMGAILGAGQPRRVSPDRPVIRSRATKRIVVECVICMGEVSSSKSVQLKCGHVMCRPCLERLFKLSLVDPQHMPPRCCTMNHIPLRYVDGFFDHDFKKAWNRKFAEYSTKNRIYCPSRRCGEWIKPANVHRENGQQVARCSRCRTKVCCICNGRWHGSDECPKDEETVRLLAQAQQEGWKRCYRCKAVVELREGCNHMTCRCGAEFCMICGARWRACDCPWFSDGPDVKFERVEDAGPGGARIAEVLHGNFNDEPRSLDGHRGHDTAAMGMPMRPRPRDYEDEGLGRRLEEQRQAPIGRKLQYADRMIGEYDQGYYVSGDYERDSPAPRSRPVAPSSTTTLRAERGGDSPGLNRGRGRRGDSMERRLADRLSDARSGAGLRTTRPMREVAMGRSARQNSIEEDVYNRAAVAPRLERLASGRVSRSFEDEAPAGRSSRRRGSEGQPPPTCSDMAGLSGPHGMSRVSQWRSFVQPGVPEDDLVFGQF